MTTVRLPELITLLPSPRPNKSIRAWAAAAATVGPRGPGWQRVGVLALSTGVADRPLIEWIARHPLLSTHELAALLNESQALIARRIEWLVRCGAARPAAATSVSEGGGNEYPDRYLVTELGMRTLAARAGVPAATFVRYGGVTVADSSEPDEPARVIRHAEHTVGVNRFFAGLAQDAPVAGWRLAEWRNEAESTRRFITADGRISWIRPDGSGVLTRGPASCSFLLEYDRGTLDGGDYRAKFDGYRRYFAAREWRDHFLDQPLLLFVCSDDRAEEHVARAAGSVGAELPVLLTTERRYLADRGGAGALGSIWCEQMDRDARYPLFRSSIEPVERASGHG